MIAAHLGVTRSIWETATLFNVLPCPQAVQNDPIAHMSVNVCRATGPQKRSAGRVLFLNITLVNGNPGSSLRRNFCAITF